MMQRQPIEQGSSPSPIDDQPHQRRCEHINETFRSNSGNPRILIVGGGMSGLSAAYHLHVNGFSNILLLEAKQQIGGRTRTISHENGILELGAQWIHGQVDNPVWKFAVEHGIVDKNNPIITGEYLGVYLTPDGTAVPQHIVDEVYEVIEDANDNSCQYVDMYELNSKDSIDLATPPTMEDCFRSHFIKYLDQCNDPPNIRKLKEGLYDWHVTFQCLDNACHSLKQLSALTWSEYSALSGKRWVTLPSGYREVLSKIASYLPSEVIVTNKPVVSIEWGLGRSPAAGQSPSKDDHTNTRKDENNSSHDQYQTHTDNSAYEYSQNNANKELRQAKLTCSDGSVYEADHVIITLPLGFLKANQQKFFSPPLPQKKQQTISAMGFGTLNKIFLVFETPFWDNATQGFQMIWPPFHDTSFLQLPSCGFPWYKDITGFDVLPNHSNVLLCWIGRRGGEIVESLSDTEISETCTVLLQHFTGLTITKVSKVIRSNWHNDPFTGGSYSSRTIEMDQLKCHTTDLASPIFDKDSEYPLLQFAGEATETKYFSTVHGAFITGKREADLLIRLYQQKQTKYS